MFSFVFSVRVSLSPSICRFKLSISFAFEFAETILQAYEKEKGENVKLRLQDIPFIEAAEIGTEKVIRDHATIGIVVTQDGSFGEIPIVE